MKVEGKNILVVGAGISGLLTATYLQRAGAKVKVLEKGRGFGGRMATRRMEGARLDHGAQFMTVRTKEFGQWVKKWKDEGVIREWFRCAPWDSKPEGHPRYCGVEGMTDVPKSLAAGLDVERSTRVLLTEWTHHGWSLKTDDERGYEADILILTAPVPQSVELLRDSGISLSGEDWDGLAGIDYEPCLSALLVLEGPSGLPEPGGMKLSDGPVAWMGDNTRKGISPDVSAVTVHSSPEFAREHWDSPNEDRLPLLLDASVPYLSSAVKASAIHRWKFNVPLTTWRSKYFWSDEFSLGLAGDAFGGRRVEGAAISGIALGEFLST